MLPCVIISLLCIFSAFSKAFAHRRVKVSCGKIPPSPEINPAVDRLVEESNMVFISTPKEVPASAKKRRAAKDGRSGTVCMNLPVSAYPTRLVSVSDGLERSIVNTWKHRQPVILVTCNEDVVDHECSNLDVPSRRLTTRCRQAFSAVSLYYVRNETSIDRDFFWICAGCQCFLTPERNGTAP